MRRAVRIIVLLSALLTASAGAQAAQAHWIRVQHDALRGGGSVVYVSDLLPRGRQPVARRRPRRRRRRRAVGALLLGEIRLQRPRDHIVEGLHDLSGLRQRDPENRLNLPIQLRSIRG